MIKGPLDADGRIAAKNATKIRGALLEMADYKKIFEQYQETHPVSTSNKAQDNARARSWAIMNVRLRMEAMESALWRTWAEAFVLGQAAAGEWIRKATEAKKAADDGYIDWANWKPGDLATALMLRRPTYFQRLLETTGATIKGMERASLTDIGNALATSIELGMGAEEAAVMIGKHVASSSRALTIAITEQNRAMSAGSIQRYKEAELEKMEWHVSDPCDKCAQNAGVVVPIGTSFPSGATQPPQHPHCRCVLLPVIPGMEEDSPVAGAVIAPMPPDAAHTGSTGNEKWNKVDEDRWITRQEALRLQRGLPPANENQLKIMRDQIKDAKVMYERGPHIIRLDKSVQTVTDEQLENVMKNFDTAYEKLPEWRRIAPDGTQRGYTLIIDNKSPGANTLAYTYLGHDSIWISPKDARSSLDAIKDAGSWFMPAASTTNQNLYTIMHELGHTVDSINNEGLKGKVRSKIIRKYKDLFSRYGRKNQNESYAEVFAQWALGEKNPVTDAYAQAFGWDLTASEYYKQIPENVQWRANFRTPTTVGGL